MIRTAFFGTAEIACSILQTLNDMPDVDLVGVVSQPDRPQGRKLKLQPTPVKSLALDLGLPVWQPDRLRKDVECLERLKAMNLDVAVIMAYGQLLPLSVLSIPKAGCINIHTSLLPKYRGAAPIQWAIWNGDPVTGVTMMLMDQGMDTGPIVCTKEIPITSLTTAAILHDQLAEAGSILIRNRLVSYVRGDLEPNPQPAEGISHARKITKEDGKMDWANSGAYLDQQVRALTPWPGCFTDFQTPDGKVERLKIWSIRPLDAASGKPGEIIRADRGGLIVATGQGALEILELQRPGGKVLSSFSFLAGSSLQEGSMLGLSH
ncbi:MAG: methionyl-tRNA formyltransferase [Verrucomicrobia bacterium]|jgi:methionyl-tRNA formyltransferase|nr:methionyl-tRNA formyltransferase [Verrucomicrobiota bacterium]